MLEVSTKALNPEKHVNHILMKTRSAFCSILKAKRSGARKKEALFLNQSFIMPVFDYGSAVWLPLCGSKPIEKVAGGG